MKKLFGILLSIASIIFLPVSIVGTFGVALLWIIPGWAMARGTNRTWYNKLNWLAAVGPFALFVLGKNVA